MTYRIRARVLAALLLTAIFSGALPPGRAVADKQQVDGAVSTPGNQNQVSLSGLAGQPQSTSAKIVLSYDGGNHLLPGDQVTFTMDPAQTTLPAPRSVGTATVAIPAGWGATVQELTTSSIAVSFTATGLVGTTTYVVKWNAVVRRGGVVVNVGNALTGSSALTIEFTGSQPDQTPPVLTLPPNITAEAVGPSGAAITYAASAADAVSGTTAIACSPASGTTFPISTTTVSCSSTDGAGNTATGSFSVTVQDTTGPVVTAPAATSAEATDSTGAVVAYAGASATDVVDGPRPVSCLPESGSTFPLGVTTITCSASDASGNSGSASFALTVTDSTKPVLLVPDDLTVDAAGPGGAPVTFVASASDTVDGAVAVVCSPASGSTFALGETTVSCSASDAHANSATSAFLVTVEDQTGPALTVPPSFSVEATGPAGIGVTYAATATDLVDGAVVPSCTPLSGTTLSVGSHLVTCIAVDAAGNDSSGSFTVNVVDTTEPVVTVPVDIGPIEATGTGGVAVPFSTSAADIVDGALNVACNPASGATFALGSTNVECSAVDAAGNTGTAHFAVEVVDSTAPELSLPIVPAAEATSGAGAVVSFDAAAHDLVAGPVPVTCEPASGSTFAVGTTAVNCSSLDGLGNIAHGSFDVAVVDTTPPVVTAPSHAAAEATGPDGAAVTFSGQSATDVVDGPLSAACQPGSGSVFAVGDNQVTCSSTDAAGNTGTATFQITVSDTTGPLLHLPVDVTAEATSSSGAPVSYTSSATDKVDGSLPASCAPASGTIFALASTAVACSSSDTRGNTSSGGFMVTVVDTTAPMLQLPADIASVEATGADGAAVPFSVTSEDLVDGGVPVECDHAPGSTFALGTTTVTCTAVDAHLNPATDTFTVTVVDTLQPELHLPSGITAEATSAGGASVLFSASAFDLVSGSTAVSCTADGPPVDSGSTFALGTTTVSCASTDGAGNSSSGTFAVLVQDTTAPQLLVADSTTEASGPDGAAVTYAVTAIDAVTAQPAIACSAASGGVYVIGQTIVSCTTTDDAGNERTAQFTVTVTDTSAPTIQQITGATIEAVGPQGATVVYTSPTATDVVDGPVDVVCTPSSGSTFPLGDSPVACTASDTRGNTATSSFTVAVADTTAPVLVVPNNLTVEATGPSGAAVTFDATASDVVDGPLTPGCTPASGGTFALGATAVGCSVTDDAGNTAIRGFSIDVVDTTAPSVVVPAPITAEATSASGAPVAFTSSASDVVDGDLPPTCSTAPGDVVPLGVTTVTCSATDAHGNTGTAAFSVQVVDTTAPALPAPRNISGVEATGPSGAAVAFSSPTATDAVDGTITSSCTPASGSGFPLGTSTVGCTATDESGNSSATSFTVTVVDTTAPALVLPGSVTVPAASVAGAVVTFTASASDVVSGATAVTCTEASGNLFALGATTVTCATTDTAGNTATGSFTVRVVFGTVAGYFQPVDMTARLNIQRAGSTVPLKWNLPSGPGRWVSDLRVVTTFRQIAIDCTTLADLSSQTLPTAGSTVLRYDTSANQYIDNWSTPKTPGTCYRAVVTFVTGQAISANFKLT
jgi:hypothetical protein